ncbi:MAG: PVC-type heme-binding CxxCH protein, partial [Pirellula sp.]
MHASRPLFVKSTALVAVLSFIATLCIALVGNGDDNTDKRRFAAAEPATPTAIFGQTVRETDARSPADELAGFHVPQGFRVDLIAAEQVIAKPMNLAFDQRGRLWVTQSTHYPYPAKQDTEGLDGIVVLEDRDQNGSFETSRVFADRLNIPIGILPYGNGALCFSIPNILYLQDTDGDGVCDRRDVVLGPFDTTRDTHGMVNSLRLGSDGWVYACHGFNNQSEIKGTDGHTIKMTSGNVFRFRPDGLRVELYSQGQVNPFGMTQDRWGFWYAADCHSKPIYQLIRGGCYPSFGRPDDGLGFVPPMMNHLHGSTAIAGLAHTKDSRFPLAMSDNFLSGNVMTCRINRNRIEYRGATAKGIEMPDLLTSDDPWFRPVDLQFGPDGHLYIADFYNKVIGHYEVPLDHPGRDRRSGRIWRLKWEGGDSIQSTPTSKTSPENVRPSFSQLTSAHPEATKKSLDAAMAWYSLDSHQRPLNASELGLLTTFGSSLDAEKSHDSILLQAVLELASTRGLGNVESRATWIWEQADRVDEQKDPLLRQSLLIGLRRVLQEMSSLDASKLETWVNDSCKQLAQSSDAAHPVNSARARVLLRILLAIKEPVTIQGAVSIIENQVSQRNLSSDDKRILDENVLRLSDVIDQNHMERFIAILANVSNDSEVIADQLLRIGQRQKTQIGKVAGALIERGQGIASELARSWQTVATRDRQPVMVDWRGASPKNDERRKWGTENRNLAKSPVPPTSSSKFFSSLTLGESYTGTWSTSPFSAPDKFSFYLVGHNGLPQKDDHQRNFVQLVRLDAAGNDAEELAREYPPRSDTAKFVEWNISEHRGKQVVLRVVDGDAAASYAWIGIGQLSQGGLNPEGPRSNWDRILAFVETFGWPDASKSSVAVGQLLTTSHADWQSRLGLAGHRNRIASPIAFELIAFLSEKNWGDLLVSLNRDFDSEVGWDL